MASNFAVGITVRPRILQRDRQDREKFLALIEEINRPAGRKRGFKTSEA
jgi:hypothetical protein